MCCVVAATLILNDDVEGAEEGLNKGDSTFHKVRHLPYLLNLLLHTNIHAEWQGRGWLYSRDPGFRTRNNASG